MHWLKKLFEYSQTPFMNTLCALYETFWNLLARYEAIGEIYVLGNIQLVVAWLRFQLPGGKMAKYLKWVLRSSFIYSKWNGLFIFQILVQSVAFNNFQICLIEEMFFESCSIRQSFLSFFFNPLFVNFMCHFYIDDCNNHTHGNIRWSALIFGQPLKQKHFSKVGPNDLIFLELVH